MTVSTAPSACTRRIWLGSYLAIGQTVEGDREVLGIWWQETEGAKFWLAVLNDLRQRGVSARIHRSG